ncbi:LPS assembly lipoprotein LptE [Salinicola peritrichatus]|uniref:LPS-assembly lipoprotein LptE n=1 Tax=Salinicola peritrichatus TaxID=1267424 RepID=UPI000DA1AAAA|nr:LPS assembly lipoprotein LptE [Salinicola peritrichatus]
MTRRPVLIGLIALALTALAGCGFQLRGLHQPELALSEISLSANVSPFSEEVRRTLESAGTDVVDDADLRLNLGDERLGESRLTRSDSGSRETEITLTAPFSVQRASDSAYLLNQQRLEVSTTVLLSTDDLYSVDQVRSEAIQRLRRDAANQLIDRLTALKSQ